MKTYSIVQRVILFSCQIVEHGGFCSTSDHIWITLETILFVGACNPFTDPGRKPLTIMLCSRLSRHIPAVFINYVDSIPLNTNL